MGFTLLENLSRVLALMEAVLRESHSSANARDAISLAIGVVIVDRVTQYVELVVNYLFRLWYSRGLVHAAE